MHAFLDAIHDEAESLLLHWLKLSEKEIAENLEQPADPSIELPYDGVLELLKELELWKNKKVCSETFLRAQMFCFRFANACCISSLRCSTSKHVADWSRLLTFM